MSSLQSRNPMFQGEQTIGLKLVLEFILAFAFVSAAQAGNLVFETSTEQLVIQSNGAVSSLIEKPNGKDQLHPAGLAFAMVVKNGRKFPASTVERNRWLYPERSNLKNELNEAMLRDYLQRMAFRKEA
jgi:hypothetical protein